MNISDELSTTPNLFPFSNVTSNIIWTEHLQISYSVFCAINAILSIPTKCYVIWLIFRGKGNGVLLEFFTLNLIVADLLFNLVGLTFTISTKYPRVSTLIGAYIGALPYTGRPLFLCLICMERYLAVVHPITFLKYKPLRYKLMCSAAVWVMTLVSGVFYVYVTSTGNMDLFLCVVLPLYSLLLSIKFFFCLAIFRALKHPGPGQKGKDREKANHVKRKAINVIYITIVSMVIQYSPLFLAGFLHAVLSLPQFYIIWFVAFAISLVAGYVHPLLYIHRVRKH